LSQANAPRISTMPGSPDASPRDHESKADSPRPHRPRYDGDSVEPRGHGDGSDRRALKRWCVALIVYGRNLRRPGERKAERLDPAVVADQVYGAFKDARPSWKIVQVPDHEVTGTERVPDSEVTAFADALSTAIRSRHPAAVVDRMVATASAEGGDAQVMNQLTAVPTGASAPPAFTWMYRVGDVIQTDRRRHPENLCATMEAVEEIDGRARDRASAPEWYALPYESVLGLKVWQPTIVCHASKVGFLRGRNYVELGGFRGGTGAHRIGAPSTASPRIERVACGSTLVRSIDDAHRSDNLALSTLAIQQLKDEALGLEPDANGGGDLLFAASRHLWAGLLAENHGMLDQATSSYRRVDLLLVGVTSRARVAFTSWTGWDTATARELRYVAATRRIGLACIRPYPRDILRSADALFADIEADMPTVVQRPDIALHRFRLQCALWRWGDAIEHGLHAADQSNGRPDGGLDGFVDTRATGLTLLHEVLAAAAQTGDAKAIAGASDHIRALVARGDGELTPPARAEYMAACDRRSALVASRLAPPPFQPFAMPDRRFGRFPPFPMGGPSPPGFMPMLPPGYAGMPPSMFPPGGPQFGEPMHHPAADVNAVSGGAVSHPLPSALRQAPDWLPRPQPHPSSEPGYPTRRRPKAAAAAVDDPPSRSVIELRVSDALRRCKAMSKSTMLVLFAFAAVAYLGLVVTIAFVRDATALKTEL
jgi:hypothetical protein